MRKYNPFTFVFGIIFGLGLSYYKENITMCLIMCFIGFIGAVISSSK